MKEAIAAIVLALSVQASLFELVAIPREYALNIPISKVCDFYTVWKKFGCLSDDKRYIQIPIIIILGLSVLVNFARKELNGGVLRLIALYVAFVFTLASIVRTIYFLQGHATKHYLLLTLPMVVSVIAIWYFLKKYPWMSKVKYVNEKLNLPEEQRRLELEIEERKRERDKPPN